MNLKFGTGGLRAVMGPGPDCLNLETVQEATLGVAGYIKKRKEEPRIAIAYDSRINSTEFARETARVLASKGCIVYISKTLMPTPFLSYSIRNLHCDLGVCITASHNGKEYNGYKVYGEDGCQITGGVAGEIHQEICAVKKLLSDDVPGFENYMEQGKIHYISDEVVDSFCKDILSHGFCDIQSSDLKIVYTPLNGAGKVCITRVLEEKGIKDIHLVEEQSMPNGNFPTCPYPNPEDDKALELGIALCEKIGADLLLATDPDSDRVGVAAKKGESYERLNGNQVGVLLLDYILRTRKEKEMLPSKPVIIKTIVTTEMVDKIAKDYDAEVISTLTGFKYIGEQIGELEAKGEKERYVLGMEESCGYLIGSYVRDKDAVGAAMMICEMADSYKKQGKTLWDVLEELYKKYGYFESSLESQKFHANEADEYMRKLRDNLKSSNEIKELNVVVERYADYLEENTGLPKSNVLKIWMQDGSTLIVRPSGTEPKIKFYREKVLHV